MWSIINGIIILSWLIYLEKLEKKRIWRSLFLGVVIFILNLYCYGSLFNSLIWYGAFLLATLLRSTEINLFNIEINTNISENRGLKVELDGLEKKLEQLNYLNKGLLCDVNFITQFFEVTKEASRVMDFYQLQSLLVSKFSRGMGFKELILVLFQDDFIHLIYADIIKNNTILKSSKKGDFDPDNFWKKKEPFFSRYDEIKPLVKDVLPAVQDIYTIPLLSQAKIEGVLIIPEVEEEYLDLLHTFASILSLTLKKINLFRRIQELAVVDDLTRVYVRRQFIKLSYEELERAKRLDSLFSFLMLDLDYFKNCNDRYGHLVGDEILRQTAEIIKKNVREIDPVGRYGGEEFVVLLPGAGLEDASLVAERIRKAIEEKIFIAYDEKIDITISIGISCYPDDGKTVEELLDKADLALYRAKQEGRNKVIAFQDIR